MQEDTSKKNLKKSHSVNTNFMNKVASPKAMSQEPTPRCADALSKPANSFLTRTSGGVGYKSVKDFLFQRPVKQFPTNRTEPEQSPFKVLLKKYFKRLKKYSSLNKSVKAYLASEMKSLNEEFVCL